MTSRPEVARGAVYQAHGARNDLDVYPCNQTPSAQPQEGAKGAEAPLSAKRSLPWSSEHADPLADVRAFAARAVEAFTDFQPPVLSPAMAELWRRGLVRARLRRELACRFEYGRRFAPMRRAYRARRRSR
jgi:hypothetical protein